MYPVFLQLENRKCVVFGGGRVAARKVQALLRAGANVTVVSPNLSSDLFTLWTEGKITCHYRPYHPGDLRGFVLAISATNDSDVNRRIFTEARETGVWVNVVDIPELCDFYVPAVVHRGDLQIAVSTNGKFPALAREIRKWLEGEIDESFAKILHLAATIRQNLKHRYADPKQRQKIIDEVLLPQILDGLKGGFSVQKRKELSKWI